MHSTFAVNGPSFFDVFWYRVAGEPCRRLRALMDYVAAVSLKTPIEESSGWRWLRLLVVHAAPPYVRYFPFVSLYRPVQSKELPATTEGE